MSVEFEISTRIAVAPETLYHAWLDSAEHSAMTGGAANVNAEPGAAFTAWDDYIAGQNLELIPNHRIVQAWRTHEFAESDPDSRIEIQFDAQEGGTKVTLRHSGLPEDGMKYKQGWVEAYFEPMKAYFEG